MAELPSEVLAWATNQVDEIVKINGIDTLVTNKVEPAASFKDTGILAREPVSRSRINWFFDLTSRYIQHLTEKDAVGTLHFQDINESDALVSERLGGTWTQQGSLSIVGTPTYVYRKDAL